MAQKFNALGKLVDEHTIPKKPIVPKAKLGLSKGKMDKTKLEISKPVASAVTKSEPISLPDKDKEV